MGLLYGNPKSFVFNNKSSEEFGLSVGYVETSADWENNGLHREIIKGEASYVRPRANHYGVKPGDPIEISFDIFPNFCNGVGKEFDMTTSHSINMWLFSPTTPQTLYFISDEDSQAITYRAVCTGITDIPGHKGILGKSLTFTCDSGYGYSEEQKIRFELDDKYLFTSKNIKIQNNSDIGIYYPKIIISEYGDTLKINDLELDLSEITSESIIIDGKNSMICDKENKLIPFYKMGLNTDNAITFPYLDIGENTWKFTGKAKITIICEFPRKAGIV